MLARTQPLKRLLTTGAVLWAVLALSSPAPGARLPVKTYTLADGLSMDQVNVIRMDARGYLWFGTSEGLCWYDGYGFTRYTPDDGLPGLFVSDILETRSGDLWAAAGSHLGRFRPDPGAGRGPRFESFPATDAAGRPLGILRFVEGPDGAFWCGTGRGLFRYGRPGSRDGLREVEVGLRRDLSHYCAVRDLLFDPMGNLWIASGSGLIRRAPDGRTTVVGPFRGAEDRVPLTLAWSPAGSLWVGTADGLYGLDLPNGPGEVRVRQFTRRDGLPSDRVQALLWVAPGRLWVGTFLGLARLTFGGGGEGPEVRAYGAAQGLADPEIVALAEDREHNVWAGTDHGGALRIGRLGFETFDETDGLDGRRIMALTGDRGGNLVLQVGVQDRFFAVFDGRRFSRVRVPGVETFGWTGPQSVLQDRRGGWWLATGSRGVWYYPPSAAFGGLDGRKPARTWTRRDGLPSDRVYAIFEDSRGGIWLSTYDEPTRLACLHPSDGKVTCYDFRAMVTALAEDGSGNIWAGLNHGGLYRIRGGHATRCKGFLGSPFGFVQQILRDHRGRLWVTTSRSGVVRVDDPAAETPVFRVISTRDGLSSDHTRFVAEGPGPVFHIGTTCGVDRLDLRTGAVKHFTTRDGLAGNLQNVAFRDATGHLWFGALLGLTRLVEDVPRVPVPPEVFIRGLRVGGVAWPLNAFGQREVLDVEVPSDGDPVAIDFSGVGNLSGETLRYRYRLDGMDPGWRNLGEQRTLELPSVRPGDYRFLVQAVDADGTASLRPAVVGFRVLTPVWRRWWFIALAVLAAGGLIFVPLRARLARRLEMERVRTRIATDLHDDIGSSLSQIAILSEVAVRKLPADPDAAVETLGQVTETSRSLVDAMSDIVWAINPARDRFSDLIHRMRRFANDLFGDDGIEHRFEAPATDGDLPLGADVRRQVFLVFKECLHNVVKHSGAERVEIVIALRHHRLELEVRDDGRGFDPGGRSDDHGHGLRNLRKRAQEAGGRLEVRSRPGEGTTVRLAVPTVRAGGRRRRSATT
ncbi:MAG: hypothetical protein KA419_09855 [Acidobacteria bacterium]|nr:hypothetical protein [Acidobacteriota bacterium]